MYYVLEEAISPYKAGTDTYYNSDCDEPGWEVATANGIYTPGSVFLPVCDT